MRDGGRLQYLSTAVFAFFIGQRRKALLQHPGIFARINPRAVARGYNSTGFGRFRSRFPLDYRQKIGVEYVVKNTKLRFPQK